MRAPDLVWLFAARALRLLGFGAMPVVLGSYLKNRGLLEWQIGVLLSLALFGDALVSLLVTRYADQFGRRRMLLGSSLLIGLAGLGFAAAQDAPWLLFFAIVGTISPNGNEVGPFQALEQACVSQVVEQKTRPRVYSWYQMIGVLAAALGAFLAGLWIERQKGLGSSEVRAEQQIFVVYALLCVLLLFAFSRLSGAIEVQRAAKQNTPAKAQKIWQLSGLFALDAFGSTLVMQPFIALWLEQRFGVGAGILGAVFAATNIVSALSLPIAGWLAGRWGLVNTMVFTHIPANVLLLLFPFAPSLELALALLIGRFCLSSMDIPARTALVMAIVPPEQRSFAGGLTQQGKYLGNSLGPACHAALVQSGVLVLPFVFGGVCKILYDLAIYAGFKRLEQ
ncbi:MAG: MFS transporter [Deinococcales bacterium]